MKDKVIKLLEAKATDGYNETIEVIPINKFNDVAQEIVKLFSIPDISNAKRTFCVECEYYTNPVHEICSGCTNGSLHKKEIRDIDAECTDYAPRKLKSGEHADCQSDGHYLCKECAFYDR